MRTAVYMGLVYIGDAILRAFGTTYEKASDSYLIFLGVLLMIFIFMDIVDFVRDRKS